MSQPQQQQDQLKFQGKKVKDQAELIRLQAERIKQQMDPRHNQD
tara:strand:- start:378 stop:509 length:132 start_codon:yes stop_codon:yes gene_type:complete